MMDDTDRDQRDQPDDVVVIRTSSTGEPASLPPRAARRLGRLPNHATAPVSTVDADRRSSHRRGGLGRRLRLLAGIGLAGGGAYTVLQLLEII